MYLAEFNWGVLRYDWDDPRVADFTNNLGFVSGLADKADGFIWRLSEAEMEQAQLDPEGTLGANPRFASTLSVWRDASSLRHFVFNTVHKRFLDRRDEWYAPQGLRLVLWWIEEGHKPSIAEAKERADFLDENGDSDFAFGWNYLETPTQ